MRLSIVLIVFAVVFVKENEPRKKLQYISIDECSTLQRILFVEKCEVDDIYFTSIVDLKQPVSKVLVSSFKISFFKKLTIRPLQISGKLILFQDVQGDKVLITHEINKADWCAVFKDGKMPKNFFWKLLTVAFGKILKDYMKCPITKKFILNRISPDSKVMMFAPTVRGRVEFFFDVTGPNNLKDHVNLSINARIVEY